MPSNFLDNPLVRYLEEKTPEAIVRAGLPTGASLGMQNFASSYAPLALNQFQTHIAQRTLAGETPDDMFTDWWGQNIGKPWQGQGLDPMQSMSKGLNRAYRRFGTRTPTGLTGPIGRTY